MIHCNNCGHVNPLDAEQCEACFEPLPAMTSCPTCQASVPEDAFFCSQCGASMPRGVAAHSNSPISSTPNSSPALQTSPGLAPTDIVSSPSTNDPLPPTNVVHAASTPGGAPTDVVGTGALDTGALDAGASGPPSLELPPTNVVNPYSGTPNTASPSDLPPTNVVNPSIPSPSDLPPTNVVTPTVPPAPPDLPPTDILTPGGPPIPAIGKGPNTSPLPETIPPSPPTFDPIVAPPIVPPAFTPPAIPSPPEEASDDTEEDSTPTFVVSPSENIDEESSAPSPQDYSVDLASIPSQAEIPSWSDVVPVDQEEAREMPQDAATPALEPPDLTPKKGPDFEQTPDFEDLPSPSFDPEEAGAFIPGTRMQGAQPPIHQSTSTIIQLPTARLLHIRTNTSITLPKGNRLSIGKPHEDHFPEIDVSGFADSDIVSRKHARLHVTPDGYYLEDVGSSNGTYINDVTVSQGEQVRLKPGDRISLGRENKVTFIFQTG